MTTINTMALSDQQIDAYDENGYLIIRNVLSPDEAVGLRRIVQQQVQYNSYPPSLKYPKPGKYTISGNKLAEPGLSPVAEHPAVVEAVECLLGQPAYLTAYVAYLRTPGDGGSGPHCDYKRWRPVGSSMNWMFSIIPLTDFDLECGPFLVAPISHKLTQVINKRARIWDITRPDIAQLSPFVDPELKAGDLLLVNQHTWHKAPAGISTQDRCGIFNKYCAVNSPPAAGYYPYNNAALSALIDAGQRLIPICFDQSIITTRLLIDCPSGRESKFLLLYDDESDCWELPDGVGWEEENLVGWDIGARIGSLQALIETQLDIFIPWMSYIADIEKEGGVCRVYGYLDQYCSFDSLTKGGIRCDWFTEYQLQHMLG
ncbi:MAG: phytanoyl-CoA dioxygenase family protein [Candidatus Poribacteria bacterium]